MELWLACPHSDSPERGEYKVYSTEQAAQDEVEFWYSETGYRGTVEYRVLEQ